MDGLTDLLTQATAKIPQQYFQIAIDGGDPVYRERVYCYELYHQLRCLWPKHSPYYLNGELDKAAHPILKKLGASHAKPDFLIHQPGYMSGNDTIIEVKTCKTKNDDIIDDLEKLTSFIEEVKYKRAIFLIYGTTAQVIADKTQRVAAKMIRLAPIEMWLHTAAGLPAYKIGYLTS